MSALLDCIYGLWFISFFTSTNLRLRPGTTCCVFPSGRCRMLKAIKLSLTCRHALLSQMCMWEHFPDRLHVELRSGFSFPGPARACVFPSITQSDVVSASSAVFAAAIQRPYSGSGFCRFVSGQLGLPGMHAAEKFPAFLLNRD